MAEPRKSVVITKENNSDFVGDMRKFLEAGYEVVPTTLVTQVYLDNNGYVCFYGIVVMQDKKKSTPVRSKDG
jgi:hypothetical protein